MRQSVRAIIIKDGQLLLMKRNKFGQQFYSLVGGGVDEGEMPEQALHREVAEESSLTIAKPRLVVVQQDPQFGEQLIYLAEYVSGTPQLAATSAEAADTADGQNTYEPIWLAIDRLPSIKLLPNELQQLLVQYVDAGFPAEPQTLKINA